MWLADEPLRQSTVNNDGNVVETPKMNVKPQQCNRLLWSHLIKGFIWYSIQVSYICKLTAEGEHKSKGHLLVCLISKINTQCINCSTRCTWCQNVNSRFNYLIYSLKNDCYCFYLNKSLTQPNLQKCSHLSVFNDSC